MSAGIDQEGVQAIQTELKRMLRALNEIATGSRRRYFLAYGTALGVSRDGGLIPWDVDVDVWVPVEDYDELCRQLKALLPPDLQLLEPTDAGYEYLFARIAPRDVDHKLVHLDLFPLSGAPRTLVAQRLYALSVRLLCQSYLLRRIRLHEKRHYSATKRLLAQILMFSLRPVPDSVIRRGFMRIVAAQSGSKATLTNPCGAYGRREVFATHLFDDTTMVRSMGMTLPLAGGNDEILRQIYGEDLSPPPSSEQARQLLHITDYFVRPLRSHGWLT